MPSGSEDRLIPIAGDGDVSITDRDITLNLDDHLSQEQVTTHLNTSVMVCATIQLVYPLDKKLYSHLRKTSTHSLRNKTVVLYSTLVSTHKVTCILVTEESTLLLVKKHSLIEQHSQMMEMRMIQ